ncbi:MAG: GMC family oxidoreductase [Chromatiaceae bacterium]|nr:GMC family oxidoreductase [Chromatiaceae bacterium]MCP5314040.1 GMC family oxidoreductase [Chromatiaceae bacterium]
MYIDARSLPDRHRLDVDLAIIGGGPAGITLARAFAGTRYRVCLIEAGGLQFDQATQALYAGESVGIEYSLTGNRLRYFGGSSNHWGGYCRPLDPIDFEARDWVPHSGWPFAIDELQPYYPTATQIVEVAPARFDDPGYWAERTGESQPLPVTGRMQLRYVQFSPPTAFGRRYGDELKQAGNIDVLLNANVTDIASTEGGRAVTHLAIRTLNGLSHSVHARQYVLATGGLENARTLLLSNRSIPAGLGNQHGLVGRYFMEHPHLPAFGEIVVAALQKLPTTFYGRVKVDGRHATAAFNPSDRFLRERRLLNATFSAGDAGVYRVGESSNLPAAPQHIDMLRAARPFLGSGEGPPDPRQPDLLGHWLGLGCACEQVPNPDSRVSLSSERDVLGLPRIRLDWRLTEQDRRSVFEHMRSFAMEFGALGFGRLRLDIEDEANWPALVAGGSHHMGTTRMHDDPRKGVVDRNCRVHGVANLHVAGSSVFPTSGAANPTLTLVALALRLADHLRERMGADSD